MISKTLFLEKLSKVLTDAADEREKYVKLDKDGNSSEYDSGFYDGMYEAVALLAGTSVDADLVDEIKKLLGLCL